jgi:hypothetical protein
MARKLDAAPRWNARYETFCINIVAWHETQRRLHIAG